MPDQTVTFPILAGVFPNQAEAFRRLQAEASDFGVKVFPPEVDVIREAREVRLAHYFRPAIVARIQEACKPENTVIVLLPSPLAALPHFPSGEGALRLVGRFAGVLVDPD